MIWFVFLNISLAVGWRMDCRGQRSRPARRLWHQSRCKMMVGAVEGQEVKCCLARRLERTWMGNGSEGGNGMGNSSETFG